MSYFVGRRNNKTYKQDGSEQYPFLIETAFDFVEFRNEIMNGNTFEGIHHKLVNDINLSGANFNILIENRRYYGTFDGNFKTIDNFTIISSLNADNFGLFTNMQGVCKNLRVTNGLINRTGLSAASTFATGFIGSSCSLGTIERCSIQGTIITPRGRAGGICGYGNNTIIKNCFTNVSITMTATTNYGAAGINAEPAGSAKTENCISIGNIMTNTTSTGYNGGICGFYNASLQNITIINCVAAMGSITGGVDAARIFPRTGAQLVNNYGLDTMTLKGVVPTINIGTTLLNGASATVNQLKSKAFYRDVLGWDTETVWQIDDENDFPKLRGFIY